MRTKTLLQSMRTATDFEDFTALGSQFANNFDEIEWHIALWSESECTVRTYCIVGGVPEDRLSGKPLEAVQAAVAKWEANPVWAK
jgi:hypothetical protein